MSVGTIIASHFSVKHFTTPPLFLAMDINISVGRVKLDHKFQKLAVHLNNRRNLIRLLHSMEFSFLNGQDTVASSDAQSMDFLFGDLIGPSESAVLPTPVLVSLLPENKCIN
jgi:hypothetical protein